MGNYTNALFSGDPSFYASLLYNVGFLFPVLTFGNGLTVLAVIVTPQFRSLTYLHVCNVAVADFLVGVGALLNGTWLIILATCNGQYDIKAKWTYYVLSTTYNYTAAMASLLALLLLAIDRLVYIVYPFVYIRPEMDRIVKCAVAGGWMVSLLTGFVPLALKTYTISPCVVLSIDLDYIQGSFPPIFLAVSVISSFCYLRIIVVSRKHRRQVAQMLAAAGQAMMPPSTAKSVTVFFLINSVFVVCWLPFFFALAIYPCEYRYARILEKLFSMGNCSSVFNVVLYSWKSKEMRKVFKQLLRCSSK